jgi:hypothetical protein
MIDSVFEGGSDLRSSEAEAQPLRPARKSNPAEALDHVGVLVSTAEEPMVSMTIR